MLTELGFSDVAIIQATSPADQKSDASIEMLKSVSWGALQNIKRLDGGLDAGVRLRSYELYLESTAMLASTDELKVKICTHILRFLITLPPYHTAYCSTLLTVLNCIIDLNSKDCYWKIFNDVIKDLMALAASLCTDFGRYWRSVTNSSALEKFLLFAEDVGRPTSDTVVSM
jgi:hypothetical protein